MESVRARNGFQKADRMFEKARPDHSGTKNSRADMLTAGPTNPALRGVYPFQYLCRLKIPQGCAALSQQRGFTSGLKGVDKLQRISPAV